MGIVFGTVCALNLLSIAYGMYIGDMSAVAIMSSTFFCTMLAWIFFEENNNRKW